MESEQSQNFNERLSQWVANQGFWFQVRYSMSGSGMKGRAMFHLLRIGFRLLVFLLLVAVGVAVFLVKRTDSARFTGVLRQDLQAGLSASELEMRGFSRSQGNMEISRLAVKGGDDTFFTNLEARNIRCKMGLIDGLVKKWETGIVSVSRLELDLRAGTDDAESAQKLADALFRRSPRVAADAFEVADATLRWGYSERAEGAIESSALKMQRTEAGWRMSFRGGKFRQNWLSDLTIVNLVVLCSPEGLVFEKAELKQGEGLVDFSGLKVIGGERPKVEGSVKISHLDLGGILPSTFRSFVEGTISGTFKASGSTNSSDGIGFEGQVLMDGKDVISLRERIHLLKALSVLDYSRNYHRIDFREGSFQMKTTRGGMELSEVQLKAEELFSLKGKMIVRLPTPEEIQAAVAKGTGSGNSPLFAGEDEIASFKETKKESEFSLKRAAQEARRIAEGSQGAESLSLFDRLGMSNEMRLLQSQESERMSRMLRYEGAFRITIQGDAFERAVRLKEMYPVDRETNRIPMRVPIEGHLYELTLKQAEDIYVMGQR